MTKTQLDNNQVKILKCNNNMKIIAGAGCGKSFTIIEKINDLIENNNIMPEEILTISFTNASVNDLKSKIKYKIDIYTFHKLAITILENNNKNINLTHSTLLIYIVDEYIRCISFKEKEQKEILSYLKYNNNFQSFLFSKEYEYFKKAICTFINLYKTNNYNSTHILNKKITKQEKNILLIIFKIYYIYLEEKNSTMSQDFDDIIIDAARNVKDVNFKYKYIIIDEFQDTSSIRFNLIHEIYKKTNAFLIVVGDDFQSIYNFSGCNLNIFLNLNNYINPLSTLYLNKNYRNSNELLQISTKFIEKNKFQIKKDLYSDIILKNPIKFCPYHNPIIALHKLLNSLIEKEISNILIISRNSHDIIEYIDNDYILDNETLIYKNIKIRYLTIHRAKGLESDCVILLNCNNFITGFPNKIENNSIIRKFFATNEMTFAEERRLMYVALTRTRSYIYILYDKTKPSLFISEIKHIQKSINK